MTRLSRLRRAWVPAIPAVLSLFIAFSPSTQVLLRYERSAVAAGEIWRLFTGHLVHLGWSHLWFNLAGLVLVWLLVGAAQAGRVWLIVFVLVSVFNGASLWFFEPDLSWYVGLSGVLHSLLVAGALAMIGKYRGIVPLLILVVLKLAWEQQVGPLPGAAQLSGGLVVVDAHLYGAMSGVIAFGVIAWWHTMQKNMSLSV